MLAESTDRQALIAALRTLEKDEKLELDTEGINGMVQTLMQVGEPGLLS